MKAVITSAGQATRTRPASYATPKALMPLVGKMEGSKDFKDTKLVPILDCIIEQLNRAGATEFCIVCADENQRDKIRAYLVKGRWLGERENLLRWNTISISFAIRTGFKGFGDAVLAGEEFADGKPVFIHADDVVSREGYELMSKLFKEKKADAVLLLRKVDDPSKFGIVEAEPDGQIEGRQVMVIKGAEEKPKENPKSNLAISAVYLFSSDVFDAIRRHPPSQRGEIELTGGIQKMIEDGKVVYGLILEHDVWLNVGTPFTFADAIANTRANPWPMKA